MGKGDKKENKGDKNSGKGDKNAGKGRKGPTLKPCSKGGVFMSGTIGITPKPDRNHYYNVVVSRDGTPGQSRPCRPPCPSTGTVPIIVCPPSNYSPPSCPQQPRRRCC